MKEKFDKITILHIEDNPRSIAGQLGQSSFFEEKDRKVFISNGLGDQVIPAVNFKEDISTSRNFCLKVLQHPVEVKEYIQLIHEALNRFESQEIGTWTGVVPDIIVFDYSMWQNVQIDRTVDEEHRPTRNILYNKNSLPIRQFVNPNFILLNKLDPKSVRTLHLESVENFSENDFDGESNNSMVTVLPTQG